MKKIFLLASIALLSLSCVKENIGSGDSQSTTPADIREVSLCASTESVQSRTFFNKDTGEITWNTSEYPMAIYDGSALNTFTCTEVSEDKTLAYFTGSADVSQTSWVAVHPSTHASLVDSKLVVNIPTFQTARANGGINHGENTSAAMVSVVNGEPQGFTMMNVGGLLKFTVAESGIKTITFSSIGGEILTGNVTLSFENGKPKATVLSGETFVTLKAADMATGFAQGDYFACVLPVNLSQGIRIDMEKIDGTSASVASRTPDSVERSGDLEFTGVDTNARWYVSELSTIELDFPNGPWPFTQPYYPGISDAAAWKKTEDEKEKLMTLRADNSILFYMSCSDYCSAGGANGLRFGKAAGDYMLFPAIPGKSLKKVAVTYLKDDSSRAAIKSRNGCVDIIGGAAVGKQLAGATYEYNLEGTARNMQYRYELTGSDNSTNISKMVLTYASKGKTAEEARNIQIDIKFWEGESYAVSGKVIQPFDEALPELNEEVDKSYTLKDTDYSFHIKGKIRLCATSTNRGLRICTQGNYIQLPAIPNMKLVKVESVGGGLADASGTIWTKILYVSKTNYVSTTNPSADPNVIATMTNGQCTLTEPLTFSATLENTESVSYYLVTGKGDVGLRNLSLTYAPVDPAAGEESGEVEAGSLQAGDQAEI